MAEIDPQIREAVAAELARQRDGQRLPPAWKLESLAWMGGLFLGLAAVVTAGLSQFLIGIAEREAEKTVQEIVSRTESFAFERVAAIGPAELGGEAARLLLGDQDFREEVSARAVLPAGAVVAFASECPAGWSTFEQLSGRFALGAGRDYPLLTSGGEATHTLTIAEMPLHTHAFSYRPVREQGGNDFVVKSNSGPLGGIANERGETEPVGGGRPHNNMPPYIALYFCRKEAG